MHVRAFARFHSQCLAWLEPVKQALGRSETLERSETSVFCLYAKAPGQHQNNLSRHALHRSENESCTHRVADAGCGHRVATACVRGDAVYRCSVKGIMHMICVVLCAKAHAVRAGINGGETEVYAASSR